MAPLAGFGIIAGIKLLATIIGTTGGGLGIISFAESHMPKKPPAKETAYRIVVGLDSSKTMPPRVPGRKPLSGAGGHVPTIQVFNEVGDHLGSGGGGWIGNGEIHETRVHLKAGQQPTYAVFTGGDDALCIAYIANTWADGQAFSWVGNWAETCNKAWYHSNIHLDGQELKCAWIDANGDHYIKGIQIHFPSFHPEVATNETVESLCAGGPPLKFWADRPRFLWELSSWSKRYRQHPRSLGGEMSREAHEDITSKGASYTQHTGLENNGFGGLDRIKHAHDKRLIRSTRPAHSARELCESPSSRGPDLLSVPEGLLCDMVSRTLWPLCVVAGDLNCFDQESMDIRVTPTQGVQARDLGVGGVLKHYAEVTDWV